MRRVLIITQNFYPENFKSNDIAFELARKGYIVDALVGIPNYPIGKYFKGYGIFSKRIEKINGVNVYRVLQIPRGKNNRLLLTLNYLSFVVFCCFWIFIFSIYKKYDLIFVQGTSPITQALPGVLLKKLKNVPLYFWVLDLWPDSLKSAGNISNKAIISFFESITKIIYNNSEKILISSKSFKDSIIQKGNYSEKIVYFPNWAEDIFINSKQVNRHNFPDGFKIMFAGNIGEAQDFESILNAALITKEHSNIKWLIVGDGRKKEWATEFVKNNDLSETVFFFGKHPIELMPSFYEQADAMLVTLKDNELFNITVPARLQTYMASAKPILGMINGETAFIIRDSDCGYVVNSGDYFGLVEHIKKIIQNPEPFTKLGLNGHNYFLKYFLKQKCIDNLCEIISK